MTKEQLIAGLYMNLLLFTKRFEVGGATLLVHPQVISFSLYDMFQEIKP